MIAIGEDLTVYDTKRLDNEDAQIGFTTLVFGHDINILDFDFAFDLHPTPLKPLSISTNHPPSPYDVSASHRAQNAQINPLHRPPLSPPDPIHKRPDLLLGPALHRRQRSHIAAKPAAHVGARDPEPRAERERRECESGEYDAERGGELECDGECAGGAEFWGGGAWEGGEEDGCCGGVGGGGGGVVCLGWVGLGVDGGKVEGVGE